MFKEIMKRMSKKMWKNQKGFSLIELIVVIAILGVLAGIAVPNVINYIETSRTRADEANAALIANAIQLARAEGVNIPTAATATAIPTALAPGYLNSIPTPQVAPNDVFMYTLDGTAGLRIFRVDTGTTPATVETNPIYP